jgi:hypothetical protein
MILHDFTRLFEEESPLPLPDVGDTTGTAEDTSYQSVKELVKGDLGVLKQVTFLNKQYHGDDPRLTSKESQTAMSAVLSKLFYKDDRTAFYMGQMEWKPNLSTWMRFFDMIGDEPLGKFFGINSPEDIPGFEGLDSPQSEVGAAFAPEPPPDASGAAPPVATPEPPPDASGAAPVPEVQPSNEIDTSNLG